MIKSSTYFGKTAGTGDVGIRRLLHRNAFCHLRLSKCVNKLYFARFSLLHVCTGVLFATYGYVMCLQITSRPIFVTAVIIGL